MAYLRLESAKINYAPRSARSLGIIVSEIIESTCAPILPKLISSDEELDIYFGRSYKSRGYHEELLSQGATLILTKPWKEDSPRVDWPKITSKTVHGDTDSYEIPFEVYDDLPEIGTPETLYIVGEDTWVWLESEDYTGYILESQLPESSLEINRSTLRLNLSDFSFPYCHPKFSSRDYEPEYVEESSLSEDIKNSLLDSLPLQENQAIGFRLDFSGVTEYGENDYIVFPLPADQGDGKLQIHFGSIVPLTADIIPRAISKRVTGEGKPEKIVEILRTYGYIVLESGPQSYNIFCADPLPDLKFYSLSGLVYEADLHVTHNILSVLSQDYRRIELYSNTIGPGDEDIKVKVENTKKGTRLIISRYDYQEVFEAPLEPTLNDDGNYTCLETLVNSRSNLVTMRTFNHGEGKVTPGEYILTRATLEADYSPVDYLCGLSRLLDFPVSEDFLLLPEIERLILTGSTADIPYYAEYSVLLKYAQEKNCQVLVSNHPWYFGCLPSTELPSLPKTDIKEGVMYWDKKTGVYKYLNSSGDWITFKGREREIEETFKEGYTGNHIFNFLDSENRLVYFYRDMSYLGWSRPGWYIFLRGLLLGKFQMETDDILYDSPGAYYTEDSLNLAKYKTNYLSDNGHVFYYKNFMNQENDVTSILMRFGMDKVTNAVRREFPYYLGSYSAGEMISGLKSILTGLKYIHPCISLLEYEDMVEDKINQTLSITLSLGIRETLDSDVRLSITLNFNYN